MPAALTVPKLLAKLSWGLDDKPIESTQQHEEAARQLDYLKGSTSHWSQTDVRLTQEVNGVSVLQARDRIRAKMREAVTEGRASRRSKHQKALSDTAAIADEHEAVAEASKGKNARVLRAVANLLQEKDSIARAAVVAQENNLQLARELHAGEPDEELLEEAEETEPAETAAPGPAEPPPKRSKTAPPHVAQADRIFEKAVELGEQKALMHEAKEAAERVRQGTNGAALKTLLRRLCKHSEQEACQLEEKVDTWSNKMEASLPCAAAPTQHQQLEGAGVEFSTVPISAGPAGAAAATVEYPQTVADVHACVGKVTIPEALAVVREGPEKTCPRGCTTRRFSMVSSVAHKT